MPDKWEITQLDPEVKSYELSNYLAVHLGQITNKADPLDLDQLSKSNTGPGMIPQLETKNVKKMLENLKNVTVESIGTFQENLSNPAPRN